MCVLQLCFGNKIFIIRMSSGLQYHLCVLHAWNVLFLLNRFLSLVNTVQYCLHSLPTHNKLSCTKFRSSGSKISSVASCMDWVDRRSVVLLGIQWHSDLMEIFGAVTGRNLTFVSEAKWIASFWLRRSAPVSDTSGNSAGPLVLPPYIFILDVNAMCFEHNHPAKSVLLTNKDFRKK